MGSSHNTCRCEYLFLHTMVEVIGLSPKVTRSHYVHVGIEKRVATVVKVSQMLSINLIVA